MKDALDMAMGVMDAAFDPAYGEGWTRKQVSDALLLPSTHLTLADDRGAAPDPVSRTVAFALTRDAADEQELLLIAVHPANRHQGIASRLMQMLFNDARDRGIRRIFLEMRDGNPAMHLYLRSGFEQVGRRPNYYRRGKNGPLDAITFARNLDTFS